MTINYKTASQFGFVWGVFTYLLAWIVGLIVNTGTQAQATLNIALIGEGVKSQFATGVPTDLASRIIAWVSGIIPFSLTGLVTVAFAGFLIAIIGAFVLNNIKALAPLMKTPLRRIVSISVIGATISGAIVSFMAGNSALPAIGATASMVIYFTIAAVLYVGVSNLVSKTQLRKLFVQP